MTAAEGPVGAGKRPLSKAEAALVAELGELLHGVPTGAELTAPASASIRSSLEMYLPEVLRTEHVAWAGESLDGVFLACGRTSGDRAATLAGVGILITDQTTTPFLVDLEINEAGDAIQAVDLRIGEPGGGRLGISGPPYNSRQFHRLLARLPQRLDSVDWAYRVVWSDTNA